MFYWQFRDVPLLASTLSSGKSTVMCFLCSKSGDLASGGFKTCSSSHSQHVMFVLWCLCPSTDLQYMNSLLETTIKFISVWYCLFASLFGGHPLRWLGLGASIVCVAIVVAAFHNLNKFESVLYEMCCKSIIYSPVMLRLG